MSNPCISECKLQDQESGGGEKKQEILPHLLNSTTVVIRVDCPISQNNALSDVETRRQSVLWALLKRIATGIYTPSINVLKS